MEFPGPKGISGFVESTNLGRIILVGRLGVGAASDFAADRLSPIAAISRAYVDSKLDDKQFKGN